MFFHRAIGKVTFPLISLAFVALSIQTTWQFLNDALPHETLVYRVLGLAVFELGAFCWFSLLTSGAENVLRTLIALVMTAVCVGGVATAAIYEVGSQMIDLGFHMDPAFLSWTPVCVLGGFVSTMISVLLYMAASPHVAHRFAHMNATGQEPAIGSRIQMLPPSYISPANQLPAYREPRALPAPAQPAANQAPQAQPVGIKARIGNLFTRVGLAFQHGNVDYGIAPAPGSAIVDENKPEEPVDGAQENPQDTALGMIEQAMFSMFSEASADQQSYLQGYAATHTLAELTAHLQAQYPSYARYITEDRVRAVMAAYLKQSPPPAIQPEPQMQNEAAPRTAPAHRRPASAAGKSKVVNRRSADDLARLFVMIEQQHPGISAVALARMANCDESTVRRYRAAQTQKQGGE